MEEKIRTIEITLKKVLTYLELLNEEKFDVIFLKAKLGMEYVNSIKIKLKKQFPPEELLKYEERILEPAKLIKIKFDDIVRLKQARLAAIAEEISHVQNQKKIANYHR